MMTDDVDVLRLRLMKLFAFKEILMIKFDGWLKILRFVSALNSVLKLKFNFD